MLSLNDVEWESLKGGHGLKYDPRKSVNHLAKDVNDEKEWYELFSVLYHQGSVNDASYISRKMKFWLVLTISA